MADQTTSDNELRRLELIVNNATRRIDMIKKEKERKRRERERREREIMERERMERERAERERMERERAEREIAIVRERERRRIERRERERAAELERERERRERERAAELERERERRERERAAELERERAAIRERERERRERERIEERENRRRISAEALQNRNISITHSIPLLDTPHRESIMKIKLHPVGSDERVMWDPSSKIPPPPDTVLGKSIRITRFKGGGSYGNVYTGTGHPFLDGFERHAIAIKFMNLGNMLDPEYRTRLSYFVKEYDNILYQKRRHCTVEEYAPFSYSVGDNDFICIVMEAMDGSFHDLIREHPFSGDNVSLYIPSFLSLWKGMVQSLLCLHSAGITHTDIKVANFLYKRILGGNIEVLLGDLGGSCLYRIKENCSMIITPQYAPKWYLISRERGRRKYSPLETKRIDIYSLAVTCRTLVFLLMYFKNIAFDEKAFIRPVEDLTGDERRRLVEYPLLRFGGGPKRSISQLNAPEPLPSPFRRRTLRNNIRHYDENIVPGISAPGYIILARSEKVFNPFPDEWLNHLPDIIKTNLSHVLNMLYRIINDEIIDREYENDNILIQLNESLSLLGEMFNTVKGYSMTHALAKPWEYLTTRLSYFFGRE